MAEIKRASLRYHARYEPLLRRIGAAVILQWDDIPDELQDRLIDQTLATGDKEASEANEEPPATREDIESFIRSVKTKPNP